MAKDALYSERNAKSNCLTTELSQVEPAMHGCDSNYEFSRLLFILCICQSSGSDISANQPSSVKLRTRSRYGSELS